MRTAIASRKESLNLGWSRSAATHSRQLARGLIRLRRMMGMKKFSSSIRTRERQTSK